MSTRKLSRWRRPSRSTSLVLSLALGLSVLGPVGAAAQEGAEDEGSDEATATDVDAIDPDDYEATRLTEPNSDGELDQVGELHGLSIADDGRVFYIGRGGGPEPITDWDDPDVGLGAGTVHVWDPETEDVTLLGTLDVFGNRGGDGVDRSEEGLVGIVLDPDFLDNGHVYLHYTPHDRIDAEERTAYRQVSRFTIDDDGLDLGSEDVLLDWQVQIERCCHAGGGMAFDSEGNLYVATGDTNSSEFTDGYAGNFPGIIGDGDTAGPHADARRTSGNTNDLNGKILRITPTEDGGYEIPDGNLFPPEEYIEQDQPALPEIYVMGTRNPSRIAIDPATDNLHTGVVGPDAPEPSSTWGPAKYDWFAMHTEAGNEGWPFCKGDGQPYRDIDEDGEPLDWYDCDDLVNDSPNNTGLEQLPPMDHHTLWYSPQGGGPVFERDEDGVPTYDLDDQTLTQPYLNGGGGQAAMGGPVYRYEEDNDSPTAWPEVWEGRWFIGDFYADRVRDAVLLEEDGTAPDESIDLRDIVPDGEGNIQHIHGWEFGPDGALYVLDYGEGAWFGVSDETALWRVDYVGDDDPGEPGDADEPCPDVGVPGDQIPVQLWTFNDFVDFGDADELDDLFSTLSDYGYSTVEPFGQPYDDLMPAEDFRDLMGEHGIHAVSSHGDQTVETFEDTVAYAQTLGQDYIGAGGPPGDFDTYEGTMEIADTLNTLGEIAVQGGVHGGILMHNHEHEFLTEHEDPEDGETKSVWQLLVENTDPDHVVFQLDVYWSAYAGEDNVALLEEYGDRIPMLHVKDGDLDTNTQSDLGEGDLDFPAIFEAAWDHVDYYIVEQDSPEDAWSFSESGFEYVNCLEFETGEPDPDPECGEPSIEEGYTALWDGASLDGWNMAGPGTFDVVADDERDGTCALESVGGMGLLWHEDELGSYRFRTDFRAFEETDNSGVFVGFPEPGDDPWVAVEEGYEIQIDDFGAGDPPGADINRTGAIYSFQEPTSFPAELGEWNTLEIEVDHPWIRVWINGELVNEFEDSDDSGRDLSSGHLGLQNHGDDDQVQFRDVQVIDLDDDPGEPGEPTVTATLDPAEPDGDDDWYVSPVTITLESDHEDATLQWRVAGDEEWITWTEPVTVDTDGVHDVEYRAVHDNGDNDNGDGDGEGSTTVLAGPDDDLVFDPDEVSVAVGDTVTFEAASSTHNVVILDEDDEEVARGGDFTADWTYDFVADEPGTYTFLCEPHQGMNGTLEVTDSNGDGNGDGDDDGENGDTGEPEVGTVSFQLDRTAPETTASLDGAQSGEVYTDDVTVSLEAQDETSGVAETHIREAGDDEHDVYVDPVTFSGEGSTTVEYRSGDVAGNVEDWQTVEFTIDPDGDPDPDHPSFLCERFQGGASFPDSPGSGHRFFIDCLAELGIVEGHAEGTFGPRGEVTREQLASFVVRAIERATGETMPVGSETFPDVGEHSTHGPAIHKLRTAGIIQGYEGGTFGPRDTVSREQTARFVVNALEDTLGFDLARSGQTFPDVASGSLYASDIDALVSASVIQGFDHGRFGPREPVTRAQMARFIGNAIGVLASEGRFALD